MEEIIMLVHSVFESISGEAGFFPQGTWCTFVRLQGCNLDCHWCDTPNARKKRIEQAEISIDAVIEEIERYGNKHILITGGEPLFRDHAELIELFVHLFRKDFLVQVETNGSLNLPGPYSFPKDKAFWVMDRKTPSSGMSGKMIPVDSLKQQCQSNPVIFKYVISYSYNIDLEWAIADMKKFPEQEKFIISPVNGDGGQILEIKDKIPVSLRNRIIFSVQLHKILNLP
jgi:7-carboxy-7-deazaguanine synthase